MQLAQQHAPAYPLLGGVNADTPLVWHQQRTISARAFLQQAQHIAQQLPACAYAINLCETPYHFLLMFAAALLRGQTNLLPPNRLPNTVAQIEAQYADHHVMDDAVCRATLQHLAANPIDKRVAWTIPDIAATHIAAVLFTSGSTGESQAHAKPWHTLVMGAAANAKAHFSAQPLTQPPTIIGTVPAQHSYGLETMVMLPLQGYGQLYGERPFYPLDIAQALNQVPAPCILVTTPVHLRAISEAQLSWPSLTAIWSATAPLSAELAQRIEHTCHTVLHEIFGCTETGTCATRRTAHDAPWRLMDEFRLQPAGGDQVGAHIHAAHLPVSAWLQDHIEQLDSQHFKVLGRGADLINIAGKRASLADLNLKLLSIPGVNDGVIFLPDAPTDAADHVIRTAALVVAPALTREQVLQALRERIDAAFLPRPLFMVDTLPRNEVTKLPRTALLKYFDELRQRAQPQHDAQTPSQL